MKTTGYSITLCVFETTDIFLAGSLAVSPPRDLNSRLTMDKILKFIHLKIQLCFEKEITAVRIALGWWCFLPQDGWTVWLTVGIIN